MKRTSLPTCLLASSLVTFIIAVFFSLYTLVEQGRLKKLTKTRMAIIDALHEDRMLAESYNRIGERMRASACDEEALTKLLETPSSGSEIIQTEDVDARDNWNLHRSEVEFISVLPSQLAALNNAVDLPHPWHLTIIDAEVNSESKLQVHATFETFTKK